MISYRVFLALIGIAALCHLSLGYRDDSFYDEVYDDENSSFGGRSQEGKVVPSTLAAIHKKRVNTTGAIVRAQIGKNKPIRKPLGGSISKNRVAPNLKLLGQAETVTKLQRAVAQYKVMRGKVDRYAAKNNVTGRENIQDVINHLHLHNAAEAEALELGPLALADSWDTDDGRHCDDNAYTNDLGSHYFFLYAILPKYAYYDKPRDLLEKHVDYQPQISAWSRSDIEYYNHYAAAVYCARDIEGDSLDCCPCRPFRRDVHSKKLIRNQDYDTLAMVTVNDARSEIVVTFRGQVNWVNWALDFYPMPTELFHGDGEIKVHRGVHLSLMSIYNDLTDYVSQMLANNPNYQVVMVGHGLGGGMASHYMLNLNVNNQFPNTSYGLITYGQLRSGNKHFADYLNELAIPMNRVVARGDYIPHMVRSEVSPGIYFVHHMQEAWLVGHSLKMCSTEQYEDFSCSNQMDPWYQLWDHSQYFNIDYLVCGMVDGYLGVDFFTMPEHKPWTDYLPPMPAPMYNTGAPVLEGGYQGFLPFL